MRGYFVLHWGRTLVFAKNKNKQKKKNTTKTWPGNIEEFIELTNFPAPEKHMIATIS